MEAKKLVLKPNPTKIIVLKARTIEEMASMIEKVEGPYTLKAAYGMNSRHYAVLELKT